jgi:hypothetical protein
LRSHGYNGAQLITSRHYRYSTPEKSVSLRPSTGLLRYEMAGEVLSADIKEA